MDVNYYRWNKDADACVDIDECEESPCDMKEEACQNAIGSYLCVCRSEKLSEPNTINVIIYCLSTLSRSKYQLKYLEGTVLTRQPIVWYKTNKYFFKLVRNC